MGAGSVRFAYADPPYPGQARRHYGDHEDFAGEVDHAALIAELEDGFDGWALSTSAKELWRVLPLCPDGEDHPKRPGTTKEGTGCRILSWHKPMAKIWNGVLTYGWEPVILRGWRPPPSGGMSPRDTVVANPPGYTWRERPEEHVTGAKPAAFCRWLFECAGLTPEDEFVDLFRGSGGVLEEWERWRSAPAMVLRHPLDVGRNARRALAKDHPQLDGMGS
jgi:hypothetical protein